jgi:peroxiredoxin Q/BCP
MLAVGDTAPDFTLPTDTGDELTLSSLRGRPVVIYFYPKDDTPGCTTESCEFRDLMPRFDASNATILGISPDSVKSHQKFKTKFELPFTLVADTEKVACLAYDVWKEKSMYGKQYMGVDRTTFVIDKNGTISHIFAKVKPAGHAAEVMEAVSSLS